MKKSVRRNVGLILLFMLGLVVLLLIKRGVDAIAAMKRAFAEDLPSTYVLPAEDSSLISAAYKGRLTVQQICRTKVRNPVSLVYVDTTYHLLMYRIDLSRDAPLTGIVTTSDGSSDEEEVGYTYRLLDEGLLFKFSFINGKVDPVQKILLSLDADSVTRLRASDSVLYYHLRCRNLSLKYGQDSLTDIVVEGRPRFLGRQLPIPMELMFRKRGRAVYLIMLTAVSRKGAVPAGLLEDIIAI